MSKIPRNQLMNFYENNKYIHASVSEDDKDLFIWSEKSSSSILSKSHSNFVFP